MQNQRFTLPKSNRICKKKQFEYIFSNAKKIQNYYFKLFYVKAFENERKVAFVASRYVGNAVARNAGKRRLRELFRLNQYSIPNQYDLIFVAKPTLNKKKFDIVEKAFMILINQIQ